MKWISLAAFFCCHEKKQKCSAQKGQAITKFYELIFISLDRIFYSLSDSGVAFCFGIDFSGQ